MYKNKKLYLFVVLSLAMLFVGCGEKTPDISIVVYDDGTIDENSIPDGAEYEATDFIFKGCPVIRTKPEYSRIADHNLVNLDDCDYYTVGLDGKLTLIPNRRDMSDKEAEEYPGLIIDTEGINYSTLQFYVTAATENFEAKDIPANCSVSVSPSNERYAEIDGVIYDKAKKELVFISYDVFNNVGTLMIPDGIVSIGPNCVKGMLDGSMVIPESVTSISPEAFASGRVASVRQVPYPKDGMLIASDGQTLITPIQSENLNKIPDNIRRIGPNAFAGMEIESLTLPDSVTELSPDAFRDSMIDTIYLSNSIKNIPENCFYNAECDYIYLPDKLETISDRAFYYLDWDCVLAVNGKISYKGQPDILPDTGPQHRRYGFHSKSSRCL